MITAAIVDQEACLVYYLAFDLLLAEAPIRDGAVQLTESHLATAGDADPLRSPCRRPRSAAQVRRAGMPQSDTARRPDQTGGVGQCPELLRRIRVEIIGHSVPGRSTVAAGFDGSPHTFIARRKMPWRITRCLATVRFDEVSVARQRSSASVVTSSNPSPPGRERSGCPCAGSRSASTVSPRGHVRHSAATRRRQRPPLRPSAPCRAALGDVPTRARRRATRALSTS
jgi:hypothetical protein